MTTRRYRGDRRGVALLVVLFVVMAVSVLSMGFMTHSDAELLCGRNTLMHTQTDYAAQGGLAHARALIQNNFPTPTLNVTQQVDPASKDYYTINVYSPSIAVPADPNDPTLYTYVVESEGYRLVGGRKLARVKYTGKLHGIGLNSPGQPKHTRAFYKSLERTY